MAITFSDSRFAINGVLDTNQSVLQNLNMLASTCGTWLTYDAHQGKWAFVINKVTASSWSFNNSNIIGSMSVSSTGIKDLYNGVKMTFPHPDVQGTKDFIQVSTAAGDRYPNEPDHILTLDYPFVNNQVQAQFLSLIQLKQSRMDQVVTFTTDYSMMSVKAGDVIDITNDVYGYAAKLFRVVTVKEVDDQQGSINIQIIAVEYNDDTYDETTLSRYTVSNANGIITQGSLGAPSAPAITLNAFATQPSITITSTAPTGGLIDSMEFWMTTDTTVTNDASRNYSLLTTVTATAGTYYNTGTTVTAKYAGVIPDNFIIKSRAVSGLLTGPFSAVSNSSSFTAVQYPSVIKTGTAIVDANGNSLGTIGVVRPGTEITVSAGTLSATNLGITLDPSLIFTSSDPLFGPGAVLYGQIGNALGSNVSFTTGSMTSDYQIQADFTAVADMTGSRGLVIDPVSNTYRYSSELKEAISFIAGVYDSSNNFLGGVGRGTELSGGNVYIIDTGDLQLTPNTNYHLYFTYFFTSEHTSAKIYVVRYTWNIWTTNG